MGAEPRRKGELIDATIKAIGEAGSLDVTVGQIARLAGVSPALAFHYFGDKEQLFLEAMRHVLRVYGRDVRARLRSTSDPRDRLQGIIAACFSPANFDRGVIAAWLNFYVLAQKSPEAHRLLSLYHRRLHSNLLYNLRPLAGSLALEIAQRLAAQIDGIYLRVVLEPGAGTGRRATEQMQRALAHELQLTGGTA